MKLVLRQLNAVHACAFYFFDIKYTVVVIWWMKKKFGKN